MAASSRALSHAKRSVESLGVAHHSQIQQRTTKRRRIRRWYPCSTTLSATATATPSTVTTSAMGHPSIANTTVAPAIAASVPQNYHQSLKASHIPTRVSISTAPAYLSSSSRKSKSSSAPLSTTTAHPPLRKVISLKHIVCPSDSATVIAKNTQISGGTSSEAKLKSVATWLSTVQTLSSAQTGSAESEVPLPKRTRRQRRRRRHGRNTT